MGPEYDDFLVHPTFLHFSAFFPLTPAFALLYICSVHTLLSISFFHCPHFYFYFTDNCLFLAFKSFLPFKSAFFHSFYKFYPSFKDMCFFFFSDIFVFQILPFLSSFINFFIFLFFFLFAFVEFFLFTNFCLFSILYAHLCFFPLFYMFFSRDCIFCNRSHHSYYLCVKYCLLCLFLFYLNFFFTFFYRFQSSSYIILLFLHI